MYGPPGCGKTMLAKAVAGECDAQIIDVRPAEILHSHWGVSEKNVEALFEQARGSTPCVLFFDEVEALTHRRNYAGSSFKSDIISTFLTEMDGINRSNEGVLMLAATNVPWSIDPAFRRPGRFDRTVFVPPPDRIARKYLLTRLLKDHPAREDIDFDAIVSRTSGFSDISWIRLRFSSRS